MQVNRAVRYRITDCHVVHGAGLHTVRNAHRPVA